MVFLAVPRTASTAITASIEAAFPASETLGQHRMPLPERCRSGEYFIFAGARNPYSRVVSHYQYRHRCYPLGVGLWTFREYVHNLVRNRLNWWNMNQDPPAVNWVAGTGCTHHVRFEHLQNDWADLPPWQETGFVPKLKMRNANPGTYNWRLFYTKDLAQMIYRHQLADFEHFGYDRDSWQHEYARQRAINRAA